VKDAIGGIRSLAVDRGGTMYVCTIRALARIAPAE